MDIFADLIANRSERDDDYHPRPILWGLIVLVLLLMVVAVVVLGPGAPADAQQASPTATAGRDERIYTITYRYGIFSPTNLRVHAGDTVRFHNADGEPVRIVADVQPGKKVPEFDSVQAIPPDGYFSYVFATAGVFGYHSEANPNQAGVIIVR